MSSSRQRGLDREAGRVYLMGGEVAVEQLQYVRQVMLWDMSFAELVRRAGVPPGSGRT
jgi:hypothetical protein